MFHRCLLSPRWWTVSVPGCSRPSAAPPAHSQCSDRLGWSFLCCCIGCPYSSTVSCCLYLLSCRSIVCLSLFLLSCRSIGFPCMHLPSAGNITELGSCCAALSCHSLAKATGELTSIIYSHPNVSMCLTACSQTANGRHSYIDFKTSPDSAWQDTSCFSIARHLLFQHGCLVSGAKVQP